MSTTALASLTLEQRQKAQEWITAQWGAAPCPFHGPTSWQLVDFLTVTPAYWLDGRARLGGPALPSLAVVCSRCGYTAFINAVAAGIIPRQVQAEEPTAGTDEGSHMPTSPAASRD